MNQMLYLVPSYFFGVWSTSSLHYSRPMTTFIHYVAYITGWLSEALITHGAWSMLNMIDHASRKQVLELHFYLTYPDEFAPVIISVDHACSAIYLFSWLARLRKSVQKMSVLLNVIHACMWQSGEIHRRGKKSNKTESSAHLRAARLSSLCQMGEAGHWATAETEYGWWEQQWKKPKNTIYLVWVLSTAFCSLVGHCFCPVSLYFAGVLSQI